MTDPPSSTTTAPTPDERWRRFTLLDALVLQAGFAAGFSLAAWVIPARVGGLLMASWLRLLVGIFTGAVVSGPLVLAVQFLARGRKARLSVDEWIWVAAAAIPAAIFAVTMVRTWELDLAVHLAYVGGIMYQSILLPPVSIDAIRRWNGVEHSAPCWWTDAFGSGIVLGFGVLALASIGILATGLAL